MNTPIEVLMIDDHVDYYNSLRNSAANTRIILKYASNLRQGIAMLKEDFDLSAVVLDGKGFIEPNQQRGSEKEDFVHEALTELTILEREQDRFIPKCVLTAWYDQLYDSLGSRVRVFDKNKLGLDELYVTEMFSFIKSEVLNTELYKLKNSFSEVYDCIDPVFKNGNSKALLSAFQMSNINSVDKNAFNNLRDLLEAVFYLLFQKDKDRYPMFLFKADGRANLDYWVRYLAGKQISAGEKMVSERVNQARVPEHIACSIEFVKTNTSILSHKYSHLWTKYNYRACLYALCEIIVWASKA
jgi:hypothetical protein